MSAFGKILFVPLDGLDNASAMASANAMALKHGAVMDVIATIGAPSRMQELIHDREYFEEVQRDQQQALRDDIDRWSRAAGCPGVAVAIEVGNPALVALRRLNLECYDLVALPAGSPDGDHALVRRLLRKSPAPVWLIQPTGSSTRRVLAAVDPNPAEVLLNRQILKMAATFAPEGAVVDVVTVWQLYGERTLRESAFWKERPGEIDQMLAAEELGVRLALEELLGSSGSPGIEWAIHLRRGLAAEILPQAVREFMADTLVIGTVARSGISGLVMGNTAERVLDSVSTSVVAVKPPDFPSPLGFGEMDGSVSTWLTTPI